MRTAHVTAIFLPQLLIQTLFSSHKWEFTCRSTGHSDGGEKMEQKGNINNSRKMRQTQKSECTPRLLFLTTSELHEVCFWGSHGLRWCWVMESGEVVAFSREHMLWQQGWMKDRLDCCKYLWGNVSELMSWTLRNAFEWSGTSSSGASTHADLVGFLPTT